MTGITFKFRKIIAWKHVSVFIRCVAFSISVEIFHHYVPYMELIQNYFSTNHKTENSNINKDTRVERSLEGHLCVWVKHSSFFIGQIWLGVTTVLVLKEWGQKVMIRRVYTLLCQFFKPKCLFKILLKKILSFWWLNMLRRTLYLEGHTSLNFKCT